MRDLLGRLYRTKTLLVCVVLLVVGGGLISIGNRVTEWNVWSWVEFLPWSEVGSILIGAGLLSVWLDHFFRREQDERDDVRLRHLLREQAPALRDAVIGAFAANKEDLARVATPETLDQIIRNSLALRLHDAQFASEIYDDIRDQAVAAGERWYDASVSIDLSPTSLEESDRAHRAAGHGADDYFAVTVRWQYTTVPQHETRRFVCVSDRREYAELASESGATSAWYLKPTGGVDASERQAFELLQFSVNGDDRPIRRAVRKGGQVYTANVGNDQVHAGQPVPITYTYRTVTTRSGHLLFFDIEQPTRDLSVDFDYTGCNVASVATLDLVPSVRPTRIERSAPALPSSTVRVSLDGWVFPRSGVAFVWTLDREVKTYRNVRRRSAA